MKSLNYSFSLLFIIFLVCALPASVSGKGYFLMKMYSFQNEQQEQLMDSYLKDAYLPALHRAGIKEVGVFQTIEGRNSDDKRIIVFIPLNSLKEFEKLNNKLESDKDFASKTKSFSEIQYDTPPYERMETCLLKAFSGYPGYVVPEFDGPREKRVYELRSYESATEELHKRKVMMFDKGESELFTKLGFQPLFFARVISGARMPNLMYMTCHENEEAQAANWKSFTESADWKEMKNLEIYKNTVSHIDKWMLFPKEYSDI